MTDEPEFLHYYFHETCVDEPAAILALVEKMFSSMVQMGNIWYMRAAPTIEHLRNFDGTDEALVYCRFSAKPRVERKFPPLLGLPKDPS